ncbi:uncharacterized protein HD556DRAFT_1311888 [Suillus plorans]|uniref:Uncharacterized protein n=1 Tax=Suillus plorans TaxID=116603 RepID=A0A9P7AG47_9AGAM|nr:uncharacterized protein HD556DRAFT_1311888 [Suillus plorans]KAG1788626.1 hypothetical protein HD556DRAFT_1311888 [Suillus plorans]
MQADMEEAEEQSFKTKGGGVIFRDHALLVTQQHTSTTYSIAACLSRVADAEWARSCERTADVAEGNCQKFLHTITPFVCGGPTSITSRFVGTVVLFCAFIAFVFGLTSVGQFFQQRQLSTFAASPSMAIIAGISQGFASITNIIIFIAMCWSLRPAHYPDMLQPEGVVENLVVLFIGRGLGLALIMFPLVSIIQLVYLKWNMQ